MPGEASRGHLSDFMELEWQEAVNHSTSVLGNEPGPSARVVYALNC